MLKFYWNGIKDNGGKLQTCSYSDGPLTSYPAGTITIYKREYVRFTQGIREAFTISNGTDIMTDYFETDMIRVQPTHPLYSAVREACSKQAAYYQRRKAKQAA